MNGTARGMACALMAILVVAGAVTGRPVVPVFSVDPGQGTARAGLGGSGPASTIDMAIKVGIAVALAREFVVGLQRLAAEQLVRAARDFIGDIRRGRERERVREGPGPKGDR